MRAVRFDVTGNLIFYAKFFGTINKAILGCIYIFNTS